MRRPGLQSRLKKREFMNHQAEGEPREPHTYLQYFSHFLTKKSE